MLKTSQAIDIFWNRNLYSKFDGINIKDLSKVRSQHMTSRQGTTELEGCMEHEVVEQLVRLKVFRSQDAKMISTHVLIGTLDSWHTFNRWTTNIHGRGRSGEEVI